MAKSNFGMRETFGIAASGEVKWHLLRLDESSYFPKINQDPMGENSMFRLALIFQAQIFFLCFISYAANPSLGFQIPGYELVYTAPIDTVLMANDLRGPIEVWTELIDQAQKEISLGEMYAYGKKGDALEPVVASIERAGARGVKIRMFLEKKMSFASNLETVARLQAIPHLSMQIMEWNKLHSGGIHHAKYFVVDGKSAYVGSQNFDSRSLRHIHELGFKITDQKIVKQLQSIFDLDWKNYAGLEKGKKPRKLATSSTFPDISREGVFLVSSPDEYLPSGVFPSEKSLVWLLSQATEEVRIQVLDYYPLNRDKTYYPPIDNALRAALARKVKVKLMVSHWNLEKPGVDYLKSLALLPGAEIRVVTIPQAKEGPIPFARVNHTKMMTIDRKIAWVGTSNWTGGYLDSSRNLELVLKNDKMAGRIADLHEQMWASPYAEKIDVMKDYPKPKKE